MEFPITELLDHQRSTEWIITYFHQGEFKCPSCAAPVEQARPFRRTKRSQLITYRCQRCDSPYNLYSGTVFQHHHLNPQQVVLLLRGLCKEERTKMLAQELQLNYKTVLELRHQLQAQAQQQQPPSPLGNSKKINNQLTRR